MLSATQAYLCTAFKTWAGLDELNGVPVNLPKLPKNSDTIEVKEEYLYKLESSLMNLFWWNLM